MLLRSLTVILIFVCFGTSTRSQETVNYSNASGSYAIRGSNSTGNSFDSGGPPGGGSTSSRSSEFPPGIFTQEQLNKGGIVLYLVAALYSFGVIGIVCGDYFLPSVDCICTHLKLSQDVAAATFMSFATTAPELFVILIATFVTKSDIGVGAVVGSGMFNILGVATIGGLAARSPIKLDWWPLYRDSLVYVFAPIGLTIVLADGIVTTWEAAYLILYYFFYFVIMCFSRNLRKRIKKWIKEFKSKAKNNDDLPGYKSPAPPPVIVPNISLTLDDGKMSDHVPTTVVNVQKTGKEEEEDDDDGSFKAYFVNYEDSISLRRISASSTGSRRSNRSRKKSDRSVDFKYNSQNTASPNHLQVTDNLHFVCPQPPELVEVKKTAVEGTDICKEEETMDEILVSDFFTLPEGTLWNKLTWLILWPATIVLHFTIPDCRFEKWRRFYPLTFLMCVFWIGISSYFGTWMVSVVGESIGIPDSVMGLTFLALGGSMPEAISTFIMSRQGEGGLGFSNSLGGNTMDICLCLGLPWLIKSAIDGSVPIKSESLQYNSIALVLGIIILLTVTTRTKFYMNKKLGTVCCVFYLLFVVVSVLVELNMIEIAVER